MGRGGRLSKLALTVGVLLRIKPIIGMVDGKLEVIHKVRTNTSIIDLFYNKIEEYSKKYKKIYLRVVNLKNNESIKILEEKITKFKNVIYTKTNHIGPVFTIHLGDNGYGITLVGIENEQKWYKYHSRQIIVYFSEFNSALRTQFIWVFFLKFYYYSTRYC